MDTFKRIATLISVLVFVLAYLIGPAYIKSIIHDRLVKLNDTINFKLTNEQRNLTFTQRIETFKIISHYSFSNPYIQFLDYCECDCIDRSSDAAKNLYEKTNHHKCEHNSFCVQFKKEIQRDNCEDNSGIAFCYIKISAHNADVYKVIELERTEVFYHFIYNGPILKKFSIKVPSTIPQFIFRDVKLIQIRELEKDDHSSKKLFIITRNDEMIYTSDKLNSKNKYNLQLPGWFQLNNTDNNTMIEEVKSKIFLANDICKDKSKWFINAASYIREGYLLNMNWKKDWKLVNKEYIKISEKATEIADENATIHLKIITTDACNKDWCIPFNAAIIQLKNNAQYLKISNLNSSLATLNVTMGYGTNAISSYLINTKQNFVCINLTKMIYDEAQWVCVSSKRYFDTTCRQVNIQTIESLHEKSENCSNIQYTTSRDVELMTGRESEDDTTTVLTNLPGVKIVTETKTDIGSKHSVRDLIIAVVVTFIVTATAALAVYYYCLKTKRRNDETTLNETQISLLTTSHTQTSLLTSSDETLDY